MTISDEAGKHVRRFDIPIGAGLRRAAWNLRAEPPARGADQTGARGFQPSGERGGRGPQQGPLVVPGRYRAQLGMQIGTDVTPLGNAQTFTVVPLER